MKQSTVIGYTGEVKVWYEKNGKRFEWKGHNSGTDALFETIAYLLAGHGFPYGRPLYVRLYKVSSTAEDDVTPMESLNRAAVPIRTTDHGLWGCSFNTTISYADIDRTLVWGENDKCIMRLFAFTNGIYTTMAEVEIDKSAVTSMVSGVQLYLEWNLLFANATVSTSNSTNE